MQNLGPVSRSEDPPPLPPQVERKLVRSKSERFYLVVVSFVGGVATTFILQILMAFTPLLLFGGGIGVDKNALAVADGQSKLEVVESLGTPDGRLSDSLIEVNLQNRLLEWYDPKRDHHWAESTGGYNLFWRNEVDPRVVKVVAFDSEEKVVGTYVLEWRLFYQNVNKISLF